MIDFNDGPGVAATFGDIREETGGLADELRAAAEAMRAMDGEAKRLSRSLGSSLRSAIDKAVFGGAKLSEVFRDLASDVLSRSLDLAIRPLQNAVTGGITGLVGELAGGLAGGLTGLFGFRDGAAFSAGRVRAFARGGVVEGPTLFPMRGATGLMGEAGPEAVMPLSRGPDGRLGVEARGRAGTTVNVTIQTPDAESFRRSRAQVTADLARAVQRGTQRL